MSNWEKEEQIDMLLFSLKAANMCSEIRRSFNLCRATPFGRVADPSYCKSHALSLIQCFETCKSMCPEEFSIAKSCIADKSEGVLQWGSCEDEVESYIKCLP